MRILDKVRKQKAVYWPMTSWDNFGQPMYGTAVELRVRWDASTEEFLAQDGQRKLSNAVVMTGQDVTVGGILMLGELTTSVVTDDPRANDGAFEIMRFDKTPTLKATKFLREAYL
jgi:hypothetical protein